MTQNSDTKVDTQGLHVIGAGFGRTGTLSLKAALEQLGFGPCYHMTEVFSHPPHAALWQAAAEGKPINWHDLFEGYKATVDWPGCTFYAELAAVYPDAKVLLSVRDPERWYESVNSTIFQMGGRNTRPPFMRVVGLFAPRLRRFVTMVRTLVWEGTFQGRFEDKDYALTVFNQHIEEVKQRIPPERLLVYNVKDGWEPLCAFLGVAVPDTPFPHLNDRVSFVGTRRERLQRLTTGTVSAVAGAVLLALLLFLLRRFARR